MTALVRHRSGAVEGCDDILTFEEVEVELEAPVGSRKLMGCLLEDGYFTRDDRSPRESCSAVITSYKG